MGKVRKEAIVSPGVEEITDLTDLGVRFIRIVQQIDLPPFILQLIRKGSRYEVSWNRFDEGWCSWELRVSEFPQLEYGYDLALYLDNFCLLKAVIWEFRELVAGRIGSVFAKYQFDLSAKKITGFDQWREDLLATTKGHLSLSQDIKGTI